MCPVRSTDDGLGLPGGIPPAFFSAARVLRARELRKRKLALLELWQELIFQGVNIKKVKKKLCVSVPCSSLQGSRCIAGILQLGSGRLLQTVVVLHKKPSIELVYWVLGGA